MSSKVHNILNMTAMVIGGLVVGAAAGLVMAPQSGRVTRGRIRVNAYRAQDHVTHVGGRVMQVMGALLDKGQGLIRVK